MSQDLQDLIRTWVERVWNRREDRYARLFLSSESRVLVEGIPGELDLDAFLAYRRGLYEAIPDFHLEVRSVTCAGDVGFMDWRFEGTHLGDGLGIPPTGRPIEAQGISRFEFVDGRLLRGGDRWNRGEMLASLRRPRIEELARRVGLTDRESQVALLLAERLTALEIAGMLGISRNTARRHAEAVMRKLGVTRRLEVGPAIARVPGVDLRAAASADSRCPCPTRSASDGPRHGGGSG